MRYETLQQVFDKVADHLLTQNRKSKDISHTASTLCRYYGPNDTRCAIGCLIPKSVYREEMEEGYTASELISEFDGVRGLFGSDVLNKVFVLNALQAVHDDGCVEMWPRALYGVAENYELCKPEILERAFYNGVPEE